MSFSAGYASAIPSFVSPSCQSFNSSHKPVRTLPHRLCDQCALIQNSPSVAQSTTTSIKHTPCPDRGSPLRLCALVVTFTCRGTLQDFRRALFPKRPPWAVPHGQLLYMLRTHTSAHEVEVFSRGETRRLLTADVYRRDKIDGSIYPVFHQMEGVRVFVGTIKCG